MAVKSVRVSLTDEQHAYARAAGRYAGRYIQRQWQSCNRAWICYGAILDAEELELSRSLRELLSRRLQATNGISAERMDTRLGSLIADKRPRALAFQS